MQAKMDTEIIVCPVCTLYLRPGMTLKNHLTSHPKQKVIEALINVTYPRNGVKEIDSCISLSESSPNLANWNQPINTFPPIPGNHSIIYQQFLSTTNQPPSNLVSMNPLSHSYITIPTVFNPQMMCQPYLYQQQQVIMSTGAADSQLQPLIPKATIQNLPDTPEDAILSNVGMGKQNYSNLNKGKSKHENHVNNITEDGNSDLTNVTSLSNTEVTDEPSKNIDEDKVLGNKKKEESNELSVSLECQGHNDDTGSLASTVDSDYLRVRTDLNKACQTQLENHTNTFENYNIPDKNGQDNSIYFDSINRESPAEAQSLQNTFQQNNLNYIPNNFNVVQSSNDQVIDMDGMQLVLCNNFMGSQMISQVQDFECINNYNERPVLMNIGGMDGNSANVYSNTNANVEYLAEESVSRESTNMSIRADEHMPPRGELSGQESNGAVSDITWTRMQYEGNSATSMSYDLFARETWEGSDCSNSEVPPLQSRVPPHVNCNFVNLEDTPTIVSVTEPPLNFRCPTCGQGFKCPKERRAHQSEIHNDEVDGNKKDNKNATMNIIGSKIGNNKPVKKLIIKPKIEVKNEVNADNVFTNKLKPDTAAGENKEKNEKKRASVITSLNIKDDVNDTKKKIKYSICTMCEMVFSNVKSLKDHKRQIHGKTVRFKCDTCEETMKNEAEYSVHLQKHPLECKLCGKYFYKRHNLQIHMKRHLGIKPHMCEFCQKAFLTKQKLKEHSNIHTGETPIKCTMCDETFRRHSNLMQHRNYYHLNKKKKVKDYICFCGEIVHSKKKLAWHKEIHETKPKACSYCSEKFVHMASLTRHMRRNHNERFLPKNERNKENVECPICKRIYLRSSLDVHIRNHSGNKPYSCSICNKKFSTKWNLKLHKWIHAARASKPFKCDQCKGAFIRESDYIAHMNSHKSVKPYTCNHCGAQFIRKYNCQRHVREHEKAKRFCCNICGKNFHRSYYLKDHMRIHSGIRPYSCHICGKTSTTKSNHNKHVIIHHAKEPISTEN